MALTEEQQAMKARNIIDGLELDTQLNQVQHAINTLFKDAPPAVADTIDKNELASLIQAIQAGTATNNKISRFLEIINKIGYQ